MNKQGQMATVGSIIVIAIGIIVCLTLLTGTGGIAQNAAQLTTQKVIVNETFTVGANGAFVDRPNCANFVGTPVVLNASDDAEQTLGYLFTTRVSPTLNYKVVTVKTTAAGFANTAVKASYTCLPQGYAEDSTSRSIVPLIVLLASLAVLAFVLYFVIRKVKELY